MTLQRLPAAQWRSYLDQLSNRMKGLEVDIGVSGRDIGDQVRAHDARLVGITYDAGDDFLEIAVEGCLHVLKQPQDIAVDEDGGRVRFLAATDRQGRTHEVRFRKPVARLSG